MQKYSLTDKESGARLTDEKPVNPVMVLGFFDGVHRGHIALINTAKEFAHRLNVPVCVWTFFSMPKAERVITTTGEKLAALSELGVDYAVLEDYSSIRHLSPNEFFDGYLVGNFAPSAVFCGFNFRYGKDAAGTAETLMASAEAHGIKSFALPPYEAEGSLISSSRIRSLISAGAVDEAAKLLSRPYSFTGEVLHGKEIGRNIGFPTVNLHIPEDKLTPPFGVYAATLLVGGARRFGVCNIGSRRTLRTHARQKHWPVELGQIR